jgi:hypothetical protein
LLRRHDGELARKLDNKQLKLAVSIPSLIRGRRLKETMQAIAGLEPYEIEAMPKDRAIALLVEHVLKMLNESREEDHCPEHRDVSTRHGTGEGSSSSNAKSKRPLKSDDSGPCDIEDIQNHADGSGGAGAARVRGPQVFLGYRVHSEKDLVERLCDKLELKGINVWCDFRSLPGGELWEESFVDGLCSSDVFVPVMSKAALAPFASLTPESTCDNVLFEHQLALELKMRGQLHRIFPVLVGELRHDEELGEIYGDFFKGNGMPSCPEVMVRSVEAKLKEHLQRMGKGAPQLPDDKRKVNGTLKAITEHQGFELTGIKRQALRLAVDEIVRACGASLAIGTTCTSPLVPHESAHKRPLESDDTEMGAAKMARADKDSVVGSKAAEKRPRNAGEDSRSDAEKQKTADSDRDCNELVRFLKDKGLGSIAPQLSEALGVEKIENLQELMKEDLEDPCCAFLKPMQKRILLKLAAEIIAHAQSLRDDALSSVATSEAESSDESGDEQSSSFDAVSAKHLGNPADFQKHISGFIRDFRDYMSDSAPETATELFHFHSHERSYCMLVWMRFAKEAVLEALMRGKWNDCIKAARQDRLLSMLETCLQQEGTKHKCWARDDFQRLHCRKSCAAAIFVTDMMSDSLRAHPASVKE